MLREFTMLAAPCCQQEATGRRSEAPNIRYRHTLATRLLEQGATFEEVADILSQKSHTKKWRP
jgi:site-specific recombinase XerD